MAFLVSEGIPLQGIDLSCETMGGPDNWYAEEQSCKSGAHLQGANLEEAQLWRANLQGAFLLDVKLQGAHLSGVNLQGAYVSGVNLQGAELAAAQLQGASLLRANLQGASLLNAKLQGANLSDSDFTGWFSKGTANFTDAWAWADLPPIGLDLTLINLCEYDNEQHDRWERPDPCIPPTPDTPKAE